MPLRWRLFQIACVLQLVIAGLHAGLSFVSVFGLFPLGGLIRALCFTAIAMFGSLGIKLVNYNYPDVLIEGRQKRYFNILYLINFLLVAFLLGIVLLDFKVFGPYMMVVVSSSLRNTIWMLLGPGGHFLIFILQFALLIGIFRLRRIIYQNYRRSLEEFTSGPGS